LRFRVLRGRASEEGHEPKPNCGLTNGGTARSRAAAGHAAGLEFTLLTVQPFDPSIDKLKKALKEKQISEGEEKGGLEEVQKLTDQHIAKIVELGKHKEDEIMKV
jgi:hypothetical protein